MSLNTILVTDKSVYYPLGDVINIQSTKGEIDAFIKRHSDLNITKESINYTKPGSYFNVVKEYIENEYAYEDGNELEITLNSTLNDIKIYAKIHCIKIPSKYSNKKDVYGYIRAYEDSKPLEIREKHTVTLMTEDPAVPTLITRSYALSLITDQSIITAEHEEAIEDIQYGTALKAIKYADVYIEVKSLTKVIQSKWSKLFPYNDIIFGKEKIERKPTLTIENKGQYPCIVVDVKCLDALSEQLKGDADTNHIYIVSDDTFVGQEIECDFEVYGIAYRPKGDTSTSYALKEKMWRDMVADDLRIELIYDSDPMIVTHASKFDLNAELIEL